jgi:hypothetical protein
MDDNHTGRQKSFLNHLSALLCVWFLAGMSLSMLLSSISSFIGMPLPPLFFFLSGMIYLTGGLLGGIWSRESLSRKGLRYTDIIVSLFVLIMSIAFLLLSIVFIIIGLWHL